jgi:hypothetical protein
VVFFIQHLQLSQVSMRGTERSIADLKAVQVGISPSHHELQQIVQFWQGHRSGHEDPPPLAAWIDDFTRMGWLTLTILGVLAALALAAELIASAVGAKRVGASGLALIGSLIGGVAGIPFGLLGLVTGPFLGAVAGELIARRRLLAAARVGFGTWVGLAFGTLIKLALAVSMVGVFAVSYWL